MRSHDYFKSFKGFCRFQTYLMYLLRSCSAIRLEGLHILFEEHSLCFIETMLCRQKFIESGFWNTILRILGNPSTTVICLFNAERVTNSVKFIFALSDFDLIKSYSFSRNLNATSLFLVIVLVVILSLSLQNKGFGDSPTSVCISAAVLRRSYIQTICLPIPTG